MLTDTTLDIPALSSFADGQESRRGAATGNTAQAT
jgi:hypothetical protein